MTPLDSPFRSHSSHRESLRQVLLLAVLRRDGDAVARLSLRWVHRQGVGALDPLIGSLGDEQASSWWRHQLLADRRTGTVAAATVATEARAAQAPDLPPAATLAIEVTVAAPIDSAIHSAVESAADAPPADVISPIPTAPVDPAPVAVASPIEVVPVAEAPVAEVPMAAAPETIPPETAPPAESLTLAQLLASLDSRISGGIPASAEPPKTDEPYAAEEVPGPAAQIPFAPAAAFEAPEAAPEMAVETAPAMASVSEEEDLPASETAAPVRSGRLARLRHLVRDCFDEVAQTFQAVIEGDDPSALEADAFAAADSAAEQPHATPPGPPLDPSLTPPPLAPTAPATPDAVNVPRLSLTPLSIPRGGRPAPAPAAHPGLERLRSWLPDEDDEQQRRAS